MFTLFSFLIFNSFQVQITLQPSDEYDILEDNSSTVSANQSAAGIRSSCIPAQDKYVHTIKIQPKAVGDVNMTIAASVDTTQKCKPDQVVNITKR